MQNKWVFKKTTKTPPGLARILLLILVTLESDRDRHYQRSLQKEAKREDRAEDIEDTQSLFVLESG